MASALRLAGPSVATILVRTASALARTARLAVEDSGEGDCHAAAAILVDPFIFRP